MSNEQKNPDESTTLHLGKFAPTHDAAKQPDADTGVTVSIKRAAAQTVQQAGQPVVPTDAGALPGEGMLGGLAGGPSQKNGAEALLRFLDGVGDKS